MSPVGRVVWWCSVVAAGVVLLVAGCAGDPARRPASSATTSSATPTTPQRPAPGDHKLSMPWDGKDRTYLLHAPPDFNPGTPIPVVIALHFYPGDGAGIRETSGLDAVADREGFLAVYPDGVNSGFNALVCCGAEDDVGFVRALVEQLRGTWGADPDRVYATGISNGGDLSYRLAVELPGVFAAIAPVSGGFLGPKPQDAAYAPKTPVSVLTFIGGQDRYAADFEAGLATWHQRKGCRPGGRDAVAAGVTRTAALCGDGSEVVAYRLAQMGHSWPGAPTGQLADPKAAVAASDLIWQFFQAHPRRTR